MVTQIQRTSWNPRIVNPRRKRKSANETAVVEFCYDLEIIITEHKFKASQIYNADEIGLYWRAMPKRTLAHDTEKSAAGFKMNKELPFCAALTPQVSIN
jgi:hypothetical protein